MVLTKDRKRPYYRHFRGKYTGRGLVVKWPGVLSKVKMLTLVWGVGVFSLLPKEMWVRILLLNVGTVRNTGSEQSTRGVTRQASLRMAGGERTHK